MNQEKIGKFIAKCRKEQHLTQANLAERLGITDRAISKWENGKNMPDASIMLELCELLKINVNELLIGERIIMEDYKEIAEKNLIEMKNMEERANKKLLSAETFLTTMAIVASITLSITGAVISKTSDSTSHILGTAICIVGVSIALVCAVYAITIEHDAGYYECPNCGYKYVPTMKTVFLAAHIGKSRKMKFPHCGKKGYHKKVFIR